MTGALVITPSSPPAREATEVHVRMLRLALGIEEARAYWEHVDPSTPVALRATRAFEERWFGAKSLERVRFLVASCADRFDAFPEALAVLRRWRGMDASTRQLVCHWHLQLSDPLYRRFTGSFLVERRSMRDPRVDRDVVLRWVKAEFPDRWAEATCAQFASKLLSASSEAGLVSAKRDPRTLLFPKVTDAALTYLLYALRGIAFEGTMIDNPYLASVGLVDAFLDQRLTKLDAVRLHRMNTLFELDWGFDSLGAWAEAKL